MELTMIPISRNRFCVFIVGIALWAAGCYFLYLSIVNLNWTFFLIALPFLAFAGLTTIINWQLWVEEIEERARSGVREGEEYTGD